MGSTRSVKARRGCPHFILPVAILILAPIIFSCRFASLRRPESLMELRTAGMSRQMHEFTCGAAAIATVMTALGVEATESEVLSVILADTSRYRVNASGALEIPPLSAADLEAVARSRGFKAVTVKALTGPEALSALERLRPALCRVQLYKEFLHFVVIRGVEDGWVYVSDPAYGHIRVPLSQFGRVWEEGDRVLLAVSRRPFLAWRGEGDAVYLKRDDAESVPVTTGISPAALYTSSLRLVTFSNSMPK
jgi:predicted double-glycine peptidase